MNKFVIQGDISFHPINELPKNLKEIKHNGTFIVALGEQTGHAHRLKGDFKVYEDEKKLRFIMIMGKTEIEHYNTLTQAPAEHKTLPLTAPFYEVKVEEDYSPILESLIKVQD